MLDQAQIDHDRDLTAFDQNHQMFRSLNQLMWQIPIIAMTLTGGLWFGVSKVDDTPLFQTCLLFLACVGNVGLIVVLARLRYIMGEYLIWLKDFHPRGFVAADGYGVGTNSHTVRRVFQVLLGLVAIVSGVLMVSTAMRMEWYGKPEAATQLSHTFRDGQTDGELARSHEVVESGNAHDEFV
ncbi:hypothetical protein [Shumkonia mesophila]|uniref:hypothetical protein n=1 Tax=Shumkonia mesophila TaxID=2838854 RepID=UPI00293430FA|nr:hypothetical protein [Shumkonia mesophila]